MAHYKKLIGDKRYLSPINIQIAEKLAEWFNDLEVALLAGHEAYTPMPVDKQREIIGSYIQYQDHVFSIVDLLTEELIGY